MKKAKQETWENEKKLAEIRQKQQESEAQLKKKKQQQQQQQKKTTDPKNPNKEAQTVA